MKVAKKSPQGVRRESPRRRATLTLPGETYSKIDELRGDQSRSAWLQRLVEREEQRRERERLAQTLRQQYTAEVRRETLTLNKQFPIHEK